MKRVGSLKRYTLSPSAPLLIDNTTAAYQLKLIRNQVLELNKQAFIIFTKHLLPELLIETYISQSIKIFQKRKKQKQMIFLKAKCFPF